MQKLFLIFLSFQLSLNVSNIHINLPDRIIFILRFNYFLAQLLIKSKYLISKPSIVFFLSC
jgi:hypothetical protein